MRLRFDGSFGALVKLGASYENHQRFKALSSPGKPLWEFKEHDHRLYCARILNGSFAEIVLLCGWVKDKRGKSAEEKNEVERAKTLKHELESEADEDLR